MNSFTKLQQFRSLIGTDISEEDSKRIWGKTFPQMKRKRYNTNVTKKIKIAQDNISELLLGNLVKFIGISGSVGSCFAKEDDDIDVFVVVRNGSMWIYRGIIVFRNIFHNKIRAKRHTNVKDKLCLNLIAEERGLSFDSDIFNFNELVYLKPIYNPGYLNYIYSKNRWLVEKYDIKEDLLFTKIKSQKRVSLIVRIMNTILYYLQLLFMQLSGHRPDFVRLSENAKKGRIEFFPKTFKRRKIRNYLKEFKSIN